MSTSGKGKKKMNRPGSKKNLGQNQTAAYEGAYGNPRLVHILLSLTGKKCQATVRDGDVYEGFLHTFNPEMDVALDTVHKCKSKNDEPVATNGIEDEQVGTDSPKADDIVEQMVFQAKNLVMAKFEDVDFDFAAVEVSEMNGVQEREQQQTVKIGEKKLEPWNDGGDGADDPKAMGKLDSLTVDGTNGWDASEMFKANEEKYGVKSDYDASLSSYTMPLDLKGQDAEKIAEATRLAQEIEGGIDYKQRIDLELDDGVTEEEKFSAVVRERGPRRDGRGVPRDARDREGEHSSSGYREKDRSSNDRDRDHPPSPQGYNRDRNNKYDGYDRHRSHRGRGGRDGWNRGPPQGYGGPNMGHSRSMGPGGPPVGGGSRNQPSMPQMDQGGQGKYRNTSSSNIPPRFITRSGSGEFSRNEDRMRHQNDANMHSSYAAPKGQRQPKRQVGGRWGRTSPSSEYQRHSPTQMHHDPAVISAGSAGGNPLGRTSSSGVPMAQTQNQRKHPSMSGQEQQAPYLQGQQQHIYQTSQSSLPPSGRPLAPPNVHSARQQQPIPPPNQSQHSDVPASITWATIASTNLRSQMGPVATDMSQARIGQGSSSCVLQQAPGANPIQPIVSVGPNSKLSWTPSNYVSADIAQQQQRPHPPYGQAPPVMGRGLPQNQMRPSMSTDQQQQQQQQIMQTQQGPRMAQPSAKSPVVVPPTEPIKPHAETIEEVKPMSKKVPERRSPVPSGNSVKDRKDGMKKELKEFGENFKLATDKEQRQTQPPPPAKAQEQHSQNIPRHQHRQPHFTNPAHQQQGYQRPQALPQQVYTGTVAHQEHSVQVPRQTVPGGALVLPNQAIAQQSKHPGMLIVHRPQQLAHSQMTQQIPVASPSIQRFAEHSPGQASPRSIDSQQAPGARTPGAMQQGVALTSPKGEISSFPPENVHVHVSGPPVSLANSPAVISVSAPSMSPVVVSQYQTTNVSAPAMQRQHQRQQQPSSIPVQAGTLSGTVPSMVPPSSVPSPTAAAAKALNPEATEFKPRAAPAKPTVIAARATPPQQPQPGYFAPYPPQGMGAVGPQTQQLMYHTGPPIEHMQPQMYPQFPQHFVVGQQHVVQQIPGQQMQQFATFDQSGQVYAGGHQAIMAQSPRIAAMPGTQQHMSQYPPDQSPVIVPMHAQQANFIQQQARPHSAHTPTQATHVATPSPAGQPTHQAGHPAMVSAHGAQQPMWMPTMVVPANQMPQQHHHHHHHANQPAQIPHPYTMPIAMANANQQAKGQMQQPIQYMHQPARPYNQ